MTPRETPQSIIQLAAWTRKEGKSRSGGLNEKGRKSYERENPGSDLKAPSKEAGNPRRASFCARMSGMKKKLTSSKTANDPDSRINKSLKAWNCSAREELNTILFAKKGGDYKRHWSQKKTDRKGKKKRADRGETPCECHTYSARDQLDEIQFGIKDKIAKVPMWAVGATGVAGAGLGLAHWARKTRKKNYEGQRAIESRAVLDEATKEQLRKQGYGHLLSAREELEVIQFGILDKFKGIFKKGLSQANADKSVAEALAARRLAARKTPPTAGYDPAVNQSKNSGRGIGTIGPGIDSYEHRGATLGKGLYDETSRRAQERLSGSRFSARDQLNTILLAASDWRDRASDNAGAIAAASGAVGALSTYVRGGIENSANWKNKRRGVAALAGGVIAGTGGYAISKLLKKDKPAQAQMAGRIGSGHQNSLSARDELNTISLGSGWLTSGFAINAMSGGGLLRGLKSAFSGGGVRQAPSGALDSLARKGLQNAGKGGSYPMPGNTRGIKIQSSVYPANRHHGQVRAEYAARDQLNTILFGEEEDFAAYKAKIMAQAEEIKEEIKAKRAAAAKASAGTTKAGIGSRIAGAFKKNPKLSIGAGLGVLAGVAGLGAMALRKKPEQQLSAQEALNTILMGADVRPRDPMGRFDQAEDGAPNPQHMKVTYGQAAATGAAGVGAGVGLKALYDKLKSMKKK